MHCSLHTGQETALRNEAAASGFQKNNTKANNIVRHRNSYQPELLVQWFPNEIFMLFITKIVWTLFIVKNENNMMNMYFL